MTQVLVAGGHWWLSVKILDDEDSHLVSVSHNGPSC
jgi:hypothetical protein